MTDPARSARLRAVAEIAVRLEQEVGFPAKLLIAQWALESRWGARPAGHANYFGIKRAKRHDQCCTVTTREVIHGKSVILDLEFADYADLEASCRDYAWLISNGVPYRQAWAAYWDSKRTPDDLEALLVGVARQYASDPRYAELVRQIADQGNVSAAIAAASVPPPPLAA